MNPPGEPVPVRWLSFLVVAVLLAAMVWMGGDSLIEVIERGVIRNRRGPDLTLARSPVLFWGLVAFFGAGLALCAGLTAACASMAVRGFMERRGDRNG